MMPKQDPSYTSFLPQFLHQWHFFLESAQKFTKSNTMPSSMGQIPFFPFEIDVNTFHKIWLDFLPIFMNTNANTVEIVITAENHIKAVYLHRANKQGMLIDLFELNKEELPPLFLSQDAVEDTYKTLRKYCRKYQKVDIGNLRVISELLLRDLEQEFRKYTETKEFKRTRVSEMVASYIDIILNHRVQDQLICYPPSPMITLWEGFASIFRDNNPTIKELLKFFNTTFPKVPYTITLQSPEYLVSYFVQPHLGPRSITYLTPPKTLLKEQNRVAQTQLILKHCKKTCKTRSNFLIHMPSLRKLLEDLVQSPLPIEMNRRSYLMQQWLYCYRNIGSCWDCYPRPTVFLEQLRYWFYSFGLRFNLRKLSYWALPDLLQYLQNRNFGLNGKLLVLSSPSIDNLTFKSPSIRNLTGFLLVFDHGSLDHIKSIENDVLLQKMAKIRSDLILRTHASSNKRISELDVLSEMRMRFSDNWGYISKVIWVANSLPSAIGHAFWKFHTNFPLPFFYLRKIFHLLNNPKKLLFVPENPNLKRFQKSWAFAILKRLAPIITDQHNF